MTNRMCVVPSLVLAVALAFQVQPVVFGRSRSTPGYVVPSFADLTITTRTSYGGAHVTTTTMYLRGSRERREHTFEPSVEAFGARHASIVQCDERRHLQLNLDAKLYAVEAFVDWSRLLPGGTQLPEPQGPVVTTTIDAVDTGARRKVGSLVARQVSTTRVVSPSAGAMTPASTRTTVGWYLDLPGLGCLDHETTVTGARHSSNQPLSWSSCPSSRSTRPCSMCRLISGPPCRCPVAASTLRDRTVLPIAYRCTGMP